MKRYSFRNFTKLIIIAVATALMFTSCNNENDELGDSTLSLAGTVWKSDVVYDDPIIDLDWVNIEKSYSYFYFIDEKRFVVKTHYKILDSNFGVKNGTYNDGGTYSISGSSLILTYGGRKNSYNTTFRYKDENLIEQSGAGPVLSKVGLMSSIDKTWAESVYLMYQPYSERIKVAVDTPTYTIEKKEGTINKVPYSHSLIYYVSIPDDQKVLSRGFTKMKFEYLADGLIFSTPNSTSGQFTLSIEKEIGCNLKGGVLVNVTSVFPKIILKLYLYDSLEKEFLLVKTTDLKLNPYNVADVDYDNLITSSSGSEVGYKYVDLGLPSKTKWAIQNLNAANIVDAGIEVAWAETETKSEFNHDNYKWFTKDYTPTKYNSKDKKTVLDPEDDAATVIMGGSWHTPTYEQVYELFDNTDRYYYTYKGRTGQIFVSKINGNVLFLPYVIRRFYFGYNGGESGYVEDAKLMTSSLKGINGSAYFIGTNDVFNMPKLFIRTGGRPYGYFVRPVCHAN